MEAKDAEAKAFQAGLATCKRAIPPPCLGSLHDTLGSSSVKDIEAAMENGASGSSTTRLRKNAVLTETGRSPWYDANGIPQDAYVVGVAGGSASGKTSVARAILEKLPRVPWVGIVSQDSFYKSLTRQQSKLAFENNYNFDHPNAFDHDLLKQCIAE